jgi:hypothetical protein
MPLDLIKLDRLRREQGYLTVGEVLALIDNGTEAIKPQPFLHS